LDAVGIREGLLPNRRRIVADQRREPAGESLVSVVRAVQGLGRQLEGAIAAAGVGASESHARPLLLRPRHRPRDQRALGREQVAVRPATFDAKSLTGTEPRAACERAWRAGILLDQ